MDFVKVYLKIKIEISYWKIKFNENDFCENNIQKSFKINIKVGKKKLDNNIFYIFYMFFLFINFLYKIY